MMRRRIVERFEISNERERQAEIERLKSSNRGKQDKVYNWLKSLFSSDEVPKVYKGLTKILSAIEESVWDYGIDSSKNKFLNFVADLITDENRLYQEITSTKDSNKKFSYLYSRWVNGDFKDFEDILRLNGHDFLLNSSLYKRSYEDFIYVFQALLLLSKGTKDYFDNTDIVDIEELYNGESIKPTAEIKEIINNWASYNDEEQEYKTKDSNKETVIQWLCKNDYIENEEKISRTDFENAVLDIAKKSNEFSKDELEEFEIWLDSLSSRAIERLSKASTSKKNKGYLSVLAPIMNYFNETF